MNDRSEGLDEPELQRALDAWGIDGGSLAYAPEAPTVVASSSPSGMSPKTGRMRFSTF